MAQSVTSNGTTSTTYYVGGGLEELTVSGASSTLTKYESVPGVCNVVIVGSGPSESISYVTSDGLGSVSEALDGSGQVTAQQLYGPYGGGRYSNGTMPTAKGFTGQYADAASSGLDYYGARYYDPLLGQFTSADSDAKGGLNRYAYVQDDPETATDPTGHLRCPDGCGGGGGDGGNGTCTSNCSPKQPTGPTGPTGPQKPKNCGASATCRRDYCDDACKRQNLESEIRRAVLREKWADDASAALADLVWDLGLFGLDFALVLSGDAVAVVAMLGDVTQAISDFAEFSKDSNLAVGNTQAAAFDATFAEFAHVASMILNGIAIVATFGFNLSDILQGLRQPAEGAVKAVVGSLASMWGDAKEFTTSLNSMSSDQAVAQLGHMDDMSDGQLEDFCQEVGCQGS